MRWQVQEAKQRFSEVLRAAAEGEPQIVTRHGEEVAVVVDIGYFRRLRGESVTLMEYLGPGHRGRGELDIDRARDLPRDIDLSS